MELLVIVNVEGRPVQLIVDTGATVSVLKPGVSNSKLQETEVAAKGVTGHRLLTEGSQEVPLEFLNGECIRHRFMICPLSVKQDGILGLDFLCANEINVDIVNRELLTKRGKTAVVVAHLLRKGAERRLRPDHPKTVSHRILY